MIYISLLVLSLLVICLLTIIVYVVCREFVETGVNTLNITQVLLLFFTVSSSVLLAKLAYDLFYTAWTMM